MAITALNTLKGWFVTAAKPLQAHYHAWMDSFWHKDESIPIEKIEGLIDELNQFATMAQVQAALPSSAIATEIESDWTLNFNKNGIVREVVLKADEACEVTIRKNGDSGSDFTLSLAADTLTLHNINLPVEDGSTLSFISITNGAVVRVAVYIVEELFIVNWGD